MPAIHHPFYHPIGMTADWIGHRRDRVCVGITDMPIPLPIMGLACQLYFILVAWTPAPAYASINAKMAKIEFISALIV